MRFVLPLAVAVLLLSGCVSPIFFAADAGDLVTRQYDLADFDKISAAGAFDVTITQGDTFGVSVTAGEKMIDNLVVETQGDTLILGPSGTTHFNRGPMLAEVTMPALLALHVSGASKGRMAGFAGESDFEGKASGASQISGDLDAGNVSLELSGSSNATLEGEAADLQLEVSGASKAALSAFSVENAEVSVSGASRAEVTVSGGLTGEASGASTVVYGGNPAQVRVDASGASTVKEQ